jgi:hypothetical protein
MDQLSELNGMIGVPEQDFILLTDDEDKHFFRA